MRPHRRHRPPSLPLGGRYLTRLVVLGVGCLAVWAALGGGQFMLPGSSASARAARAPVVTALAPSPFGELGVGVVLADGREAVSKPPAALRRAPASGVDALPAVDAALLENVLDKTRSLPARAYYHLATLAAQTPPTLLEQHARRDLTFAHLWSDPDKYRGELVYLRGYLRTLKKLDAMDSAPANPAGLARLYQGDLFTDDSRPNPFVIIVPEVAADMPTGSNILENVTFAGYFFKVWRYRAGDVERAAPLLIGRLVAWTPSAERASPPRLSAYLAAGSVLFILVLGGVVWSMYRTRSTRTAPPAAPEPATLAELARLENEDIPDPWRELEQPSGEEQNGA